MNVYDAIEAIGDRAKSEIILTWYDYLDLVSKAQNGDLD